MFKLGGKINILSPIFTRLTAFILLFDLQPIEHLNNRSCRRCVLLCYLINLESKTHNNLVVHCVLVCVKMYSELAFR